MLFIFMRTEKFSISLKSPWRESDWGRLRHFTFYLVKEMTCHFSFILSIYMLGDHLLFTLSFTKMGVLEKKLRFWLYQEEIIAAGELCLWHCGSLATEVSSANISCAGDTELMICIHSEYCLILLNFNGYKAKHLSF